ncbi:sensor histidine kinase [Nonomuraea typhae]|uniref:sensor histidine kinase n=1 Tax=Nonomuraea typhae TaxID=2603600 RepID=UPI0012F719D1|nr:histidine kinase [Nonomuraea typhae]
MRALAGALALLAGGSLVAGALMEGMTAAQMIYIGVGLITPVLGWLIAVRRPDVRYGWVLLATAAGFGLGTLGVGLNVRTGLDVLGQLLTAFFPVFYGLQWVFLPLLFPDGRLPSPRWRWIARLAAGAIVLHALSMPFLPLDYVQMRNPLAQYGTTGLIAALAGALGQGIVMILAFVAFTGLIVRAVRAGAAERRAYRWIVIGGALSLAGLIVTYFSFGSGSPAAASFGLLAVLLSVPAAIAVALVRHQLLDIRLGIRGSRLSLVFDMRPTVSELLSDLSPALQDAEPGAQLTTLARAVQEGLDVRWAEVSLKGGGSFLAGAKDGAASVRESVAGGLGELTAGPKNQGRFSAEDRRLLHAFAVPVGLAIRSAALATRLVNAQEAERRRLERNLHDGVQQQLVALIAGLELARASGDAEMLPPLREQARQTLDDLRELATGIHPSVLTQGGLVEAVESRGARLPVPTTVLADPGLRTERFPDEVEGALYFTVSEALANALKHAAAAKILVRLSRTGGRLRAEVSDDGRGFDPPPGALGALADRLSALGGGLKVTSTIGEGTTVSAWVPAHD